jgi:hypothetical protein
MRAPPEEFPGPVRALRDGSKHQEPNDDLDNREREPPAVRLPDELLRARGQQHRRREDVLKFLGQQHALLPPRPKRHPLRFVLGQKPPRGSALTTSGCV